ncbi:MAG: flap endonuclease-1 [archaeon]
MGVKLTDIVPIKKITFEDLSNKVVAVDSSNMLYQFLSSIRQRDGTPLMDSHGSVTSHLVGLFSRIPNIMEKNIKPAFVFDGKPPALKFKERERRAERKTMAEQKYAEAERDLDSDEMLKYSKQFTKLDKDMVTEAKKLLSAMGLPVIQAPSEAEAQCAYICKQKGAWAAVSQDFDTLLYGTPRLLRSLTLSTKKRMPSGGYVKVTPELIELKEVLKELELDQKQLIVLSILVGTDYNIGGVKGIGPKKALKLVQSGQKFEKIFEELDPSFDWKEIYDVFDKMPIEKEYDLKFTEPDDEEIKKILVDKHEFSEERVNSTLERLRPKPKDQQDLKKWF